MKKISFLFLLNVLSIGLVHASFEEKIVQYVDCHPADSMTNHRVIVSFESVSKGTLFLSSGIEDDGSQENSGVMTLFAEKNSIENTASFKAENSTSTFLFSLPADLLFKKTLNNFKASLDLKTKDGQHHIVSDLNCFTRLY